MSINLDEIVANSGSMDELLSAVGLESEANAKASGQLMQLVDASKGTLSPLEWLKSKISPNSTAGKIANDGVYKKYVIDMMEQGEEPLSRDEFMKKFEEQQSKSKTRGA